MLLVIFRLGTGRHSPRLEKIISDCKFQILGIKTTVGHYIIKFSRNSSCLYQIDVNVRRGICQDSWHDITSRSPIIPLDFTPWNQINHSTDLTVELFIFRGNFCGKFGVKLHRGSYLWLCCLLQHKTRKCTTRAVLEKILITEHIAVETNDSNFTEICFKGSQQATGLDAWASRVKCPARFMSHLHEICIYLYVLFIVFVSFVVCSLL